MNPRWDYLVTPLGREYKNTKKIANQEFTINTSIEDANFVNRIGIVNAIPIGGEIPVGSLVVVHHNVFRTYLDAKGKKRKSNEFFREGEYLVSPQRIYMYKENEEWKTTKDYCFISPIDYTQDSKIYRSDKKEEEQKEILKGGMEILKLKIIF